MTTVPLSSGSSNRIIKMLAAANQNGEREKGKMKELKYD